MNLFSSVLRVFGLGKLANPEVGAQHSGPTSRGTEADIVVSDERALQVSAVWSCVRLIAETVGSLPLGFYRTVEGGDRQPLERTHPVVELFARRPNAMMTPQEFREAMTCQLALWGNGYARIEWVGERPVALVPLMPEHVTPMRLNGEVTYHYTTPRGVEVLAKRSVFHLKGFGADGVVGLSPLSYARNTLGLSVSADKAASKMFANGGRPGGVLMLDRFLDPKQRELVRELYSNLSATADNAGKLWVLEGGMKYEGIGIPPDDMQMLESRAFQLSEIARFFRVPSHLINDTEKSTSWGTGIEQLNIGFLTYTLRPYLTRWEAVIRDALLSPVDRQVVVVEHNVEGLLRADSAARANLYSTMVQNGLMSRNEVRRLENLPKSSEANADALTVQTNLAPIDKLGQTAGPAPVFGRGAPLEALVEVFRGSNRELAEAVRSLPPPVVHVRTGDIEIREGDTSITMPEGMVQLDATINTPEVTVGAVTVEASPAQVVLAQPRETVDVIERDANHEIKRITRTVTRDTP